jgi:virulence factor Mce-like protein
MIKRTPKPAQLIAMIAFAFSCFALILFLWVSFGGPVPLKPQGYRVHASFDEAVQLATEGDVRISGVTVGKIKEVQPKEGLTDATLEIESRYAPLPDDVKAILRSKTLLGETYVELTPGTKGVPTIPENGSIAEVNVSPQVELDEVIRTFDEPTRRAFGDWLVGQADAVEGHGDQLNQAFGVLPMFFSDSNDLFTVLHRQDRALSRVFRNTGKIFKAIDSRPGQLTELIISANKLLRVTAQRSQQLTETFNEFPQFLREARQTTEQFQQFSNGTQNLIKNTGDFAEASSAIMKQSVQVTEDANDLVRNLEPMLDAADKGLPATDQFLTLAQPTLAQLNPFLQQLNPVLKFVGLYQREITAFAANDAAAGQAQATLTGTQQTVGKAASGHYLRAFATLTPDNLAYMPNKTTKTRSNAYPTPGWYDRIAQGLQVFDSGACGTIPVPTLNPDATLYTNANGLNSLLPQINQIVYAGENTPQTPVTSATGIAGNLGQSPNNAANLPAPNCDQQQSLSFQGASNQFSHVNAGN